MAHHRRRNVQPHRDCVLWQPGDEGRGLKSSPELVHRALIARPPPCLRRRMRCRTRTEAGRGHAEGFGVSPGPQHACRDVPRAAAHVKHPLGAAPRHLRDELVQRPRRVPRLQAVGSRVQAGLVHVLEWDRTENRERAGWHHAGTRPWPGGWLPAERLAMAG